MASFVAVSGFMLGREMIGQTLHSTSQSILSSIKFITENYDIESNRLFDRLDLKFKLDIISEFVHNIETKNIETKNKANHKHNSVIDKCINYINDIISLINKEVSLLETAVKNYNKKWIGTFSYSEFKLYYSKIEDHVKILEQRFTMLTNILNG